MGQQMGGALFAIGGRLIGGALFGPVGAMVGGLAGGLIGSLLFNRSQKPLIPDYQLASSSYGHPIPIIYGNVRLPGTMIWQSEIVTQSGGSGGKGFGQKTYKYIQSGALAFCEGPARLLKLWTDGNLFLDMTSGVPHEITKYQIVIREHDGTENQMPDPLLQNWVWKHVTPADSCPAYRGLAYVVIQNADLTHFSGRFPNVTALWSSNISDIVIVKHLVRWPTDPQTTGFTLWGNGVTVDWTRLTVATLTSDSTVRVFDIISGTCLISKTWAQIWDNAAGIGMSGTADGQPGNALSGPVGTSAIAACPGGFIYVALQTELKSYIPIWNYEPLRIAKLDPNSLQPLQIFNVTPGPPAGYGLLPNDAITQLVAFELVSPTGTFDMLAGTCVLGTGWLFGPSGPGYWSGVLPLRYMGIWGYTKITIGKKDTVAGSVEVWFLNYGLWPASIELYRATVNQPDVSGWGHTGWFEHMATLTDSDFGVPGVRFGLSPSAVYDATDNTLIISNNSGFQSSSIKWSPDTKSVIWQVPAALLTDSSLYSWDLDAGRFANGGFLWGNSVTPSRAGATVFDPFSGSMQVNYTGTVLQTSGLPGGGISQQWGYSSANNCIIVTDGVELYAIYLQRANVNEVPVAAIIRDICHRAGLDDTMIDVSAVTQMTQGYGIMEEKPFGSAIADLCHTYSIDMVESDYVLKFVPRGSRAPVATITQDDLGSIDAQDPSKFWLPKHALEQEMPLQINIRFIDPSMDYQASATYSKRIALPVPTQFSRRIKTIDLPVVATADEARHIAEQWLYTMWAERDTFETALSWEYIWLDPTDNVTVNLDNGDSYIVRIETTDVGADFSMRLALASEDASTYVLSTTPGASTSAQPQVLVPSAFLDLLLFNLPLLQDIDDLGGTASRIYYAGGPTGLEGAPVTATLYKSTDALAWPSFNTLASSTSWGTATNTLGDTPAVFATDYVNIVTMILRPGSAGPVSCSYLDLMNGANAALVGQEIIQFQNVTTNADGTVTLSVLLRGRRGTDWATGTHSTGDIVVFLIAGDIQADRLPLAELNNTEYYRLVPLGRTLEQTSTDAFAYQGFDMKPYAPVNFKRVPGRLGDLVLSWKRRTRIGGWLADGTDTVALNEESEAYEAYILPNAAAYASFDPTKPASYRRAFLGLAVPSVSYTTAMMTADGFTPETDILYLVVFQLSAVVGRGFPGYELILPPSAALGPPIGTQVLLPAGIASTAVLGVPTLTGPGVTPGPYDLFPAGIASSEALGVATVTTPGASAPSGIYVLQGVVPAAIGASPAAIKVVEATSDGADTFWTSSQVTTMKSGGGLVLGYFSLGEAESYRSYYAGAVTAGIVGPVDPDWPGNYQVKYWTTQWRTVAYAWCDSLIAAGFDGMYMDVVDEWGLPWAQANVTGGGATNAANAMVTLIQAIRTHAHVTKPSFKIWVNGGEELFAAATAGTYLACLDGMFKEQVCYANPSPGSFTANSTGDRNAERTMLRNATDSGKPVILIEYVTGSPAITDVKAVCATWGFGYYIADPNLDLNGIDTEGL